MAPKKAAQDRLDGLVRKAGEVLQRPEALLADTAVGEHGLE